MSQPVRCVESESQFGLKKSRKSNPLPSAVKVSRVTCSEIRRHLSCQAYKITTPKLEAPATFLPRFSWRNPRRKQRILDLMSWHQKLLLAKPIAMSERPSIAGVPFSDNSTRNRPPVNPYCCMESRSIVGSQIALKDRNPMRGALEDLRYAAAVLRRTPSLTAVAVLTLALGIARHHDCLFGWIDGMVLHPFRGATDDGQLAVLRIPFAAAWRHRGL